MAKKFTNYRHLGVVLNKVRGKIDVLLDKMRELNLPLLGKIQEDETIKKFEMIGKPLLHISSNADLLTQIRPLVQKIVELTD
jgi:CO dehydrogenase nickel-insertion accessory protein CooC1